MVNNNTFVTEENKSAEVDKIKSRVRLKTTVLLLLFALLSVATATVAWFTLNTFSAVDNLEMSITTGADLRIAVEDLGTDISKYYKVLTNEMVNKHLASYNTELDKILLDPVTSSDGIKMYTRGGVERTANDTSYLEFPIYLIASKEMYVHLTTDGLDDQNITGTSVTTNEVGAKADVVNAVRVSFDSQDGAKIYEPNKSTPVAGQTTFNISTPMNYTNDTRIVHLDKLSPKRVMVRVWVEGEDPECDNDIQDAQLTIDLTFAGTDENNEPIA